MNEKRYEVRQENTILGVMFRVLDTMQGQYVGGDYYFSDEAEKLAMRLNNHG